MPHTFSQRSLSTYMRALGAAVLLVLAAPLSHAQQRVALVIGNSAYRNEAPLRNPVNDAKLIAQTLKAAPLRFDQVIEVHNASRVELLAAMDRFKPLADRADYAVVYYSGHGMINSRRQNHLLPVEMPKLAANAGLNPDTVLKSYGVTEDDLLDAIEGAKVQVVVLDACRDNGFDPTRKSTAKGLTPRREAARNRLLAYATEEGRTAEDGQGGNSAYAQSLARNLSRTDWPLLRVFDEVASDVEKATAGAQLPTRTGNLRTDVYLLASLAPEPAPARPAPATLAAPATVLATPTPQPAQAQRQPYEPEMARIPAGSFTMGSPASEAGRYGNEGPQRRVDIKAFELGKTEVTQGQWKAVMGSNPSGFSQCGDTCPVENVSWDDIQQYLQKLNQMSGQRYRLPSEAEWEYAARAGSTGRYGWGEVASHEHANYGKDTCCGGLAQGRDRWVNTAPVGQFPANAFGLYDMHGNVFELVQDVWHDNYNGAPTDGSVWVSGGDQSHRVLRGGSWFNGPQILRSALRGRGTPAIRDDFVGFRLARTVP